MSESAPSRQRRRLLLSSVKGQGESKETLEEHPVFGFLRDAINPDKYLVGTIAVILSIAVPVTMIFALMFGYPEVCWGLIAAAVCMSVTVGLRARKRIIKNRRDDD